LEDLLGVNAPERRAFTPGEAILESASFGEEFWANSKSLDSYIVLMNQEINNQPITDIQAQSLVRFFEPSVSNHLEMIHALLNSERTYNTVYPERRRNILRWNRGTRLFMLQLQKSFGRISDVYNAIDENFVSLEYCRMILAAPNNSLTCLGEQFAEYQNVFNAQSLLENDKLFECYAKCQSFDDLHSSVMVYACVCIINAQPKGVVEFSSRSASLQVGMNILKGIGNSSGTSKCQPG
jgi:hypothetical protein